jgi:hypothetical protein
VPDCDVSAKMQPKDLPLAEDQWMQGQEQLLAVMQMDRW